MCDTEILNTGKNGNDSFVVRNRLEDPRERQEIFRILQECDEDFCPPLSKRGSTRQRNLREATKQSGVQAYFEELAGQYTLLWKREGHVIAFLSFCTDYVCEELKEYKNICYLTTLCVQKRFRGQGLSARLYRLAEDYIRENFPDAVPALRTWSTNSAQLHLMQKLGYKKEAVLKNDRGAGIDTLYFIKN